MRVPPALLLALLPSPTIDEPSHEANAVYAAAIADGLTVGGRTVRLPAPTFADGQSAEEQRAALRELAGSDRAAEALLRDSVTAPFRLKLDDEEAEGAIVRSGALYFTLRVDLEAIDPDELSGADESGPVEAGNMRFEAEIVDGDPPPGERLIRTTGRLLDRIAVTSTARVVSSRLAESLVIASTTADDSGRWRTIEGRGPDESLGAPRPYAGGIGYAKLTRWRDEAGVVLVELHFAFAEPLGWFDGAPILRSKFSLIAQDQIRRLRRELARER